MTVRVGIVGTSWWADSMYLPALADHPVGVVTALCGRRLEAAQNLADNWSVPHVFTDWVEMLDSGEIDAVIVAATNDTHAPVTNAALDRGMPVLCEKPIATKPEEAARLGERGATATVATMVPFTYRWMPTFVTAKQAIDDGLVGDVHHLTFRYMGQFGRDLTPAWRFDPNVPGAGIIADLGPHALHLAEWLNGPIVELGALAAVRREPDRPTLDAEDTAWLNCRFANGSLGALQVCAMSWAGTPMGQIHDLDVHGTGGRLSAYNDWDATQTVTFVPDGEAPPGRQLPLVVDDHVRMGNVHDTYRDVFRTTEAMTREWVTAIAQGRLVKPDLTDGARSQVLVDAALESVRRQGRLIDVTP